MLTKTGAKIGSAVRVSVMTTTSQTPVLLMAGEVTALEAEFDNGGTFTVLRGYDPAHRLFRGRRTESYTQMTASDIATKVAQRAGLKPDSVASTSTVFEHVSQAGTTDWELLDSLARDAGYEISVRDGKFELRPAGCGRWRAGAGSDREPTRWCCSSAADLLRFRAVADLGRAGQGGGGPRLGHRQQEGADDDGSGEDHVRRPAGRRTRLTWRKMFGDPVYVSTDVPHRTQAEVDARGRSAGRGDRGRFRRVRGRRPRQPSAPRRRGR